MRHIKSINVTFLCPVCYKKDNGTAQKSVMDPSKYIETIQSMQMFGNIAGEDFIFNNWKCLTCGHESIERTKYIHEEKVPKKNKKKTNKPIKKLESFLGKERKK